MGEKLWPLKRESRRERGRVRKGGQTWRAGNERQHTSKMPAVSPFEVTSLWALLILRNINGLYFFWGPFAVFTVRWTPGENEPSLRSTPLSTSFSLPLSLIAFASFPVVYCPADEPHFCQSITISTVPSVHLCKVTLSNSNWNQS